MGQAGAEATKLSGQEPNDPPGTGVPSGRPSTDAGSGAGPAIGCVSCLSPGSAATGLRTWTWQPASRRRLPGPSSPDPAAGARLRGAQRRSGRVPGATPPAAAPRRADSLSLPRRRGRRGPASPDTGREAFSHSEATGASCRGHRPRGPRLPLQPTPRGRGPPAGPPRGAAETQGPPVPGGSGGAGPAGAARVARTGTRWAGRDAGLGAAGLQGSKPLVTASPTDAVLGGWGCFGDKKLPVSLSSAACVDFGSHQVASAPRSRPSV